MNAPARRYEPGLPAVIDASHNYMIIIDLLGEGDLKTSWTTARCAADQAAGIGATTYSRYVKIFNRPMLDALLADIAERASESNVPLIAFDAHGSPDRGLLIAPTDTYAPWTEVKAALQRINERTRNGTGVIMSSCYGMAVCSGIDITQPAPFQFCIAPKNEITAECVETKMRLFVSTMFETQSMDRAVQHLQPDYDYWHSNEYFYSQFIGFLQKNTRGRGKQRFVEELTSKLLLAQAGDRNAVKMARQMAKNGTKDFEKHFVRLSNVFLHGRNHLSFKQIDEYAEKWPVY